MSAFNNTNTSSTTGFGASEGLHGSTGVTGLAGQGGDLRGTTGGAPGYGSSVTGGDPYAAQGNTHGLGASAGTHSGLGSGTHTTGTRDPVSHQATEVGRHPVAAASHPTHPVAGAEIKDSTDLHSHSHGHSSTHAGTHTGTHAGTGFSGSSSHPGSATHEAKEAAKHPGAAASHPAHPGLAAEGEDARKGGHQTDAGARRDPTAPNPGNTSAFHTSSSSSHPHSGSSSAATAIHPGTSTGPHEGAHKPTMSEKIGGAVESLVGKVTGNPAKVEEGNIKKTEGKEAALHSHAHEAVEAGKKH
ncbi:hypothetical protein JCM10213_001772 [Rhodosporidiobolus nylandii]